LAEKADLSTDAIGRLERGLFSPTLRVLVQLARGLETDVATLVGGLVPDPMTENERALVRALRGIVHDARGP
jgi:transcriptional regulator with XRE-family HTH domain